MKTAIRAGMPCTTDASAIAKKHAVSDAVSSASEMPYYTPTRAVPIAQNLRARLGRTAKQFLFKISLAIFF
jgi:hypothetical protein